MILYEMLYVVTMLFIYLFIYFYSYLPRLSAAQTSNIVSNERV
jgi:hypothetical protein